ncbi:MAG: Nramp family divalent metal transporter [Spirosomataceae bacterium]
MKWNKEIHEPSLPEVNKSIFVRREGSFWNQLRAFIGPGLLVAVGYVDPGNWATALEGGSRFGFTLLSVILISNLFAMLLQHLSLKLGIATGKDLAQACKSSYSKPVSYFLWFTAEIAIAATDLAEVIGSAVALQLLFDMPLAVGIVLTGLDVLLILFLQSKGFRYIEALVGGLLFFIFGCFGYEIWISDPVWGKVLVGLIPQSVIVSDSSVLYIAIGILGATVMPHNLYLHSSIVQTRNFEETDAGKKHAIRFATIDSTFSLFLAFFVNAAILILSATAFHGTAYEGVADIREAYQLLAPVLGVKYAGIVFAFALLAAGQNSTLTGTIAGQIVMEGFIQFKLKPWVRRLITRLVAIIPALVAALYFGESGVGQLLVFSQVILSVQLSFAVVPLITITSDSDKMGAFVNTKGVKWTAFFVSGIIIILNVWLLWSTFMEWGN